MLSGNCWVRRPPRKPVLQWGNSSGLKNVLSWAWLATKVPSLAASCVLGWGCLEPTEEPALHPQWTRLGVSRKSAPPPTPPRVDSECPPHLLLRQVPGLRGAAPGYLALRHQRSTDVLQ